MKTDRFYTDLSWTMKTLYLRNDRCLLKVYTICTRYANNFRIFFDRKTLLVSHVDTEIWHNYKPSPMPLTTQQKAVFPFEYHQGWSIALKQRWIHGAIPRAITQRLNILRFEPQFIWSGVFRVNSLLFLSLECLHWIFEIYSKLHFCMRNMNNVMVREIILCSCIILENS